MVIEGYFFLRFQCLLLAQSGHRATEFQCPLSGVHVISTSKVANNSNFMGISCICCYP